VTVADDALVAVPGLQIGMLVEKVRDLGLDRPGEQGTGPVAQDFGELIVKDSWLNQLDDVILGHGISLLRWRSGGVKHPHDMPPSRFPTSPTLGDSSLADIHFSNARTIVLVQDNLNIHSKASLYEAFPAAEARRLVERFEWNYTPKHGSWLDLAESELGVLTSQCLDRRIPDKATLIEEIAAWEHDRNANNTKADWQFTTKNARIKLKHLYPAI
jgi:hypothetical protein